MSPNKTSISHRVLLVDDDEAVRTMMSATLDRKGFPKILQKTICFGLAKYVRATETGNVLRTY